MSVEEHEPKFYVHFQFVCNLTDIELGGISAFLNRYGYEINLEEGQLIVEGFEERWDADSFNDRFLEEFGKSPSEFRKSL